MPDLPRTAAATHDAHRAIKTVSPGSTANATASGSQEAAIDARINEARENLAARFAELERRVDFVKHRLDPAGWLENPWARVGLAAAVGFALGSSNALRPIVRTVATTAFTTLLNQAIAHLTAE